jgi:hypothetical protein
VLDQLEGQSAQSQDPTGYSPASYRSGEEELSSSGEERQEEEEAEEEEEEEEKEEEEEQEEEEAVDDGDDDGEGYDEGQYDEDEEEDPFSISDEDEEDEDEDEDEDDPFSISDEDVPNMGATVGDSPGDSMWQHLFGTHAGQPSTSTNAGESPYDVKQRDAKFYLANLHTPLYPGCQLTVIGACYVLANEKIDGRMSNKSVDRMCRYIADIILPKGNLHPPSLYLLKKCLKVEEADKFEMHVCTNDCYRFPKLKKSQYHDHRDDKCPKCQQPRFKVVELTSGTTIKPNKVFWDLGLARTLRECFFSRPEFNQQRGKGRDKYDTDFYKSDEAQRLDARVGGALMKAENSAYEIGFDFFQPFVFKTYSVGIVVIRWVLHLLFISTVCACSDMIATYELLIQIRIAWTALTHRSNLRTTCIGVLMSPLRCAARCAMQHSC